MGAPYVICRDGLVKELYKWDWEPCLQARQRRIALRPRGKAHAASIVAGIARGQVRRASEQMKSTTSTAVQDIPRVVFSSFGRGQNSAQTRKVFLGLNESVLLLFSKFFVLV